MSGFDKLAWQREYRKTRCNWDTKVYEKTINGFLMRTYRNMKSRVTGVQKLKAHLYLGKELLDKQEFYNWSKNNQDFLKLFADWSNNSYNRKLSPAIDRIDSSKGYTLTNMRWLTHSENSRLIPKNLKNEL